MAVQQLLIYSFTPDSTGTEFVFSDIDDPIDPLHFYEIGEEEVPVQIPVGETGGGAIAEGEYEGPSYYGARVFTIQGRIAGDSPSDVASKLNQIVAGNPIRTLGKFRQQIQLMDTTSVSDTYIYCRVSGIKGGSRIGENWRDWSITYRAGAPFYCNSSLETPVAVPTSAFGGDVTFTPGGSVEAFPIFTFTPSHIGTLQLVENNLGGSIVLNIDELGDYVFDCEKRLFTLDGTTNAVQKIAAGSWFSMLPTSTTITSILSNAFAAPSISVTWRKRWMFV